MLLYSHKLLNDCNHAYRSNVIKQLNPIQSSSTHAKMYSDKKQARLGGDNGNVACHKAPDIEYYYTPCVRLALYQQNTALRCEAMLSTSKSLMIIDRLLASTVAINKPEEKLSPRTMTTCLFAHETLIKVRSWTPLLENSFHACISQMPIDVHVWSTINRKFGVNKAVRFLVWMVTNDKCFQAEWHIYFTSQRKQEKQDVSLIS